MKKLLFTAVLALFMTACGETIKPDDQAAEVPPEDSGATAGGIDGAGGADGAALGAGAVSYEEGAINDPNSVLSERVVYFAYDSNVVGDEYTEMVKHHGKYLSFNAGASIRLEGHADERGTREYNVALGERRAEAVKQLMLYEGAGSNQISIVSYGEEKPVAFGHDDESMRQNRRVELVYQ